ncbi:hypothetical protein H105_03327 [Trichophyton soudanense CBS 452.61]|uniref:Uncharacterized protein n=1 Tax=Trichophyton soudanense CBS 452.61 TaxID=1215331 RepID=A0A022XX03_TRISD|nr:hypothetical protein H105_03327 [Trichophyton soudanense CBS 452.61]EZG07571.1 hypothetical protein H106_03158 [Trichophyton rubrum CBS 735.88]
MEWRDGEMEKYGVARRLAVEVASVLCEMSSRLVSCLVFLTRLLVFFYSVFSVCLPVSASICHAEDDCSTTDQFISRRLTSTKLTSTGTGKSTLVVIIISNSRH